MQTTTLGPLAVSQLALGAMYFGTKTDRETAFQLLDAFVAAGGNFIDTANNYAFWVEGGASGDSEALLGEWLALSGRRADLVIATKVGARPNRLGAALEDIQGLSRAAISEDVDQSLRRLRTDHIDLYYAHIDDRTAPLEETLDAFDRLIKAGKVRAIGCSNYMAWRIEQARRISRSQGLAEYVCVQQRHSYFQPAWRGDFGFRSVMGDRGGRGIEEGTTLEHLDYARVDPTFRIVAYSPLLGGGYADPGRLNPLYATPDNIARRAVLDSVAAEIGATINQVVLAWMLAASPAVIPLVAASSLAQLSENLGAADIALTADQLARLEAAA